MKEVKIEMIIQASSLTKDIYQPKDIAKMLGCSVRTVQNYCDENKIISYRNVKNRRLVDRRLVDKDKLIDFLQSIDCYIDDIKTQRQDVIYARVSTNKQKSRGDLDRQVEKISAFIISQNPQNLKVFK